MSPAILIVRALSWDEFRDGDRHGVRNDRLLGGPMKYLGTLFCGWVLGGMTLIAILMRGEKFK